MAAIRRPAGGARTPERVARGCDAVLDLVVLAFAAWTVIYHVCLYLHVRSVWAAVAEALAFVPCAWLAVRRRRAPRDAEAEAEATGRVAARRPRPALRRGLLAVSLVAAAAGAVLFGWALHQWTLAWILWLVAAAGALALTFLPRAADTEAEAGRAEGAGGGAAAALAWSAALATLSLFVVNPDTDDAQYVHVAGWVAAHGRFPLRDTIFTDQGLPSLFFPPLSSFEALLGTLARGIPFALPDLVYLGVVPVATVLAVLALWRLLRSWRVPLTGLALTVALVFLLFDARDHWLAGSYFIGRDWQGKVLYVTILIPTAFVLLGQYAERPSGRGLLMLAAAGAAGVGLTTTAIFTLPLLAVACLLPALRRSPRAALAWMAAAVAYPLAMGVLTLALGGRNPDEYDAAQVVPSFLAHRALGSEQLGAIALFAALAGALAIPRRCAARMVAVTVLVVGLLSAPGVPGLIFDATGLGRVLWRLAWLIPVPALLGALAVRWLPSRFPVALRALPAAATCALMLLVGVPVWSSQAAGSLAGHPARKLSPTDAAAATAILARAPAHARILAPQSTSRALLALSGTVTVVNPLGRYTKALAQFGPRGHSKLRVTLKNFVENGLETLTHATPGRYVSTGLSRLGVDVACTRPGLGTSDALLARDGWTRVPGVPRLVCRRAPAA